MSIRDLVILPDPLLRSISKPVERFDGTLHNLLDDMMATMYDAPGIGLAGIQIAVPLRIVTIDVAERAARGETLADRDIPLEVEVKRDPIEMINPDIVSFSDETSVEEEGCLSIPDYFAEVERPAACRVEYLDRHGKKRALDAEGILSTVIQHEVDHLNGKMFVDYLSSLKRNMVIRKFTKLSRQNNIKPVKAIYA